MPSQITLILYHKEQTKRSFERHFKYIPLLNKHYINKVSLSHDYIGTSKVLLSCYLSYLSANGYDLGLSNELLIIIIARGVAKLWLVGGLKIICKYSSNQYLLMYFQRV